VTAATCAGVEVGVVAGVEAGVEAATCVGLVVLFTTAAGELVELTVLPAITAVGVAPSFAEPWRTIAPANGSPLLKTTFALVPPNSALISSGVRGLTLGIGE